MQSTPPLKLSKLREHFESTIPYLVEIWVSVPFQFLNAAEATFKFRLCGK